MEYGVWGWKRGIASLVDLFQSKTMIGAFAEQHPRPDLMSILVYNVDPDLPPEYTRIGLKVMVPGYYHMLKKNHNESGKPSKDIMMDKMFQNEEWFLILLVIHLKTSLYFGTLPCQNIKPAFGPGFDFSGDHSAVACRLNDVQAKSMPT